MFSSAHGVKTGMAILLLGLAAIPAAAAPPKLGTAITKPPTGLQPVRFVLLKTTLPKNGDVWRIGESEGVYWDYSPAAGKNVNIWLVKGTLPVQKIVSGLNIENTVHHWVVPESVVPAGDYRVMIESVEKPTIKSFSAGFFTIQKVVPGITVLAPNGGQTWTRGATQTIGWAYAGKPGTTVSIFLEKPGMAPLTIAQNVTIEQQFAHLGSYAWAVPMNLAPATDYKIKVQVTGTQFLDSSDQPFTIK